MALEVGDGQEEEANVLPGSALYRQMFSAMAATGDGELCLQGLITVVERLNDIHKFVDAIINLNKLFYACNQGVDKIIDLARLIGACVVALGPSIAGIFTPSDELAQEVIAASELSGEKFWRLPMEESYLEQMKSGVADMVNTGGRQGGSITAALFLKQFVDEKVQWMHIDMAGPVWNDKKHAATGFGVSTPVEWVLKNSSSS
ncbi:leucine aminopeptidase 2, chloroplastic-like [Hordeum vulgare subsp. vulgare]|uniref:leucine aminopeptidase 2, chloroplastic-like n=1 Tax=Hordeum vulgare subsp. vulgare TaxID=112509 RepID=UPI001D1A341C|nr:leucine aminopeptidase 2, chloroplastic-like [Hordeum vulgare subsp. vulgare]